MSVKFKVFTAKTRGWHLISILMFTITRIMKLNGGKNDLLISYYMLETVWAKVVHS